MYKPTELSTTLSDTRISLNQHELGQRSYECKDHLGNVHLVLSDRKPFQSHDNTLAAYEYYPFGMLMQSYTSSSYRYGFNGMEKDDEVSGSGNSYTTHFRAYDSRLGRWKSIDPKSSLSPWHSSYQSFSNNPILYIDPKGDKEYKDKDAYAKANEGKTWDKDKGEGDWLASDRTGDTDTWKNANKHNLQQKKGYKEYTNFTTRAAFYGWVNSELKSKGHEVKWAGVASTTVETLDEMINGKLANFAQWSGAMDITNPKINASMKKINTVIIKNAWNPLREIYNSKAKITGNSALNWDAQVLIDEQAKVQPYYTSLARDKASKKLLRENSRSTLFGVYTSRTMMTNSQDIFNTNDRWQYGMFLMIGINIKLEYAPKVGGDWKKGTLRYTKK